ncbi:hypothetical protein, partial [Kitasatospora nipponensis]|uniref:hypothetical protein n=1 Tax=Kitasatospora nipponensis TaxID=258049 RepID=UPI0031D91CE3
MPELIEAVRQAVTAGTAPAPDVRLALAQTTDPAQLIEAGLALEGLRDPAGELRALRVVLAPACPAGPVAGRGGAGRGGGGGGAGGGGGVPRG